MALEKAMYVGTYEDSDVRDLAPCLIDTDKMRVVEFHPALSSRWREIEHAYWESESWIYFGDGRCVTPMTSDEFNDYLDGLDEKEREEVLYLA